jgi:hypothetical protein
MFHQVTQTHVESDTGFSLKSGPKDYRIYSEGKREIYVTAEAVQLGRDGWGEAVYLSALPDCRPPPNNIYAITRSAFTLVAVSSAVDALLVMAHPRRWAFKHAIPWTIHSARGGGVISLRLAGSPREALPFSRRRIHSIPWSNQQPRKLGGFQAALRGRRWPRIARTVRGDQH